MNPVTAIRLAFGAVVVGVYMLIQLGVFGHVAKVEQAINGAEAVYGGPPASEAKGLTGKIGWVGQKMNGILGVGMRDDADRARTAMNPDLYSTEREIRFDFTLPLDAFLLPGETPPTRAMEPVLVSARAGEVAMQRCASELIGDLIRGCALAGLTVDRVLKDGFGDIHSKPPRTTSRSQPELSDLTEVWKISVELAYLPTFLPGSASDKAGWAVERPFEGIAPSAKVENTPQAIAQARRDVMQAVRMSCEHIRDTQGICALSNITLREDLDTRTGLITVEARAGFYWLRPPTVPEENTVIQVAMASNPALPVMGRYRLPDARPGKLAIEHTARKDRAEARARFEAERLEAARQRALGEEAQAAEPRQAPKPPSSALNGGKPLNGGGALNGGSGLNGGGGLNGGNIRFKSVE